MSIRHHIALSAGSILSSMAQGGLNMSLCDFEWSVLARKYFLLWKYVNVVYIKYKKFIFKYISNII